MKKRFVHLGLLVLVLGVVGCDQASKGVAERELKSGSVVELLPGAIDLRYAENYGVAFNVERFLPETLRKPIVLLGGAIALLWIATAWYRSRKTPSLQHLAFATVLGGAIGNIVDRQLRGYVVDFIHIHHWPIFNVADMAICFGVAMLIWHSLRSNRRADL